MKKAFLLIGLFLVSLTTIAQFKLPTPDVQIKSALLSVPTGKKDSAAVYGFASGNELILLRKGLNELICIADDPAQAGFSVACYHKDLEPFMKRGRELRKQGKSFQEIFDTREKEVKAKTLAMPDHPTTLYVYSAGEENYNRSTGEVKSGYLRSVVYIPYATPESTGLPLKPEAPGLPWIMHPGTHGAHIMINPPKN